MMMMLMVTDKKNTFEYDNDIIDNNNNQNKSTHVRNRHVMYVYNTFLLLLKKTRQDKTHVYECYTHEEEHESCNILCVNRIIEFFFVHSIQI